MKDRFAKGRKSQPLAAPQIPEEGMVLLSMVAGTLLNVLLLITFGPDIFGGAAVGGAMLK